MDRGYSRAQGATARVRLLPKGSGEIIVPLADAGQTMRRFVDGNDADAGR